MKPERPLVSVILPVYNGEQYLASAIESALYQEYEPLEILVIDDGSTDGTSEVAARYLEHIIYVHQPNAGVSAARNRGLRLAKGEFITFLDADDVWPRYKLHIQVNYLLSRPDLEMVQGLIQRQQLTRGPDGKLVFTDEWLHPYMNVLLGSMLFRRSAIEKIGFFDDSLRISQDTDYWFRARELGIPCRVLCNLSLLYRIHQENLTKGKDIVSIEFVRALKMSLDRRRKSSNGKPISLPLVRYIAFPKLAYLKEKPLVSVVITTYNNADNLEKALESVYQQDYEPLEIILVDDGSTDHTAEIVVNTHPQIRYLYQEHQGGHVARSAGLAEAIGEFVAFLDSNDRWGKDKLKTQIDWLLNRPEIDYTLGHMRYIVDDGTELPPWLEAGFLLREYPGFTWSAFVGRREVFEKVDGFEAWYELSSDRSWFTRARERGIQMTMLTDVLLHHRIRPENLNFETKAMKKSLLYLLRLSVRQKRRVQGN
jgi:glycosyltransferase involved in cell wall biosynthesis